MKRLAAALLAGAMSISLCSCSLTYQEMIKEERSVPVPPKMVFLGDSIAAGYGLDGYSSDDLYTCPSYANLLEDEYSEILADECGHTMINDAVSGDTSQDLIDLLNSGVLDDDLKNSDAVIISIGGNDVLKIIFTAAETLGWDDRTNDFDFNRVDIKEAINTLTSMSDDIDTALKGFEENIDIIIDNLGQKTNGDIYIQTLYNPIEYFEKWQILVDFAEEKIDSFNKIVKDHAEKDGVKQYTVVDVGYLFEGRNSQLTNIAEYDIHPNADGHKLISEAVDDELRKGNYSYETEVPGETKLTNSGKALVICVTAALALIAACIVILLINRKKKN